MCFMAYQAIQGVSAGAIAGRPRKGYDLLYWGSVILALGNGTVEAFINPVVATMFSREKTKWLNILHAGWPGGLVVGGIITIALAKRGGDGRLAHGGRHHRRAGAHLPGPAGLRPVPGQRARAGGGQLPADARRVRRLRGPDRVRLDRAWQLGRRCSREYQVG